MGREAAAMKLLFPAWSPSTEEVGAPDGGVPPRVHLRAARWWLVDGSTFLAVLLEGSSSCLEASCTPGPTQLAVFGLKGTMLVVVTPPLDVGQHGAEVQTDLGPDPLPMTPEATLLPVVETTRAGRRIRLLALMGKALHIVFERMIADPVQTPRAPRSAGCLAAVTVDEFGTFPYPLKVKEHCGLTGKTTTEIWRWEGTQYVLHGPASDAAAGDQGFSTGFNEE